MQRTRFDPYHEWLGIPPAEQPPNYYRLLGLADFEANPTVIQNAADRQMAHIRRFAVGPRGPVSQTIANYIAEAAGTLLDPARKGPYDDWLLGIDGIAPDPVLAEMQEAPLVFIDPPPVAPVQDSHAAEPDPVVRVRRRFRRTPRARRHESGGGAIVVAQWLLGGLAGVALALLLVAWLFDISPRAVLKKLQEPQPAAK